MQESSISEKIKELRTDLKMNQKNFSAAIGIRQSTLSSYENGVVTPSNDVLLTIAQKFHVSLDWLFGLSENKVQISTLSDILWVGFDPTGGNAAQADKSDSPISRYGEIP